jgi:phospholipase/lecithinase/hemolysin
VSFLSSPALAVAMAAVVTATCEAATSEPFPGHPAAAARPVAEVVSFGDSWTDAGTFGYVYGTAGSRSWAQLLTQRYGADQEPNRRIQPSGDGVREVPVGGLDYAEGGAVVGPVPAGAGTAPRPVSAQLAAFLRQHGRFSRDQLVTVGAGANDILAALNGGNADRRSRFARGELTEAELGRATRDAVGAARREAALVAAMLTDGARWVAVLSVIDQGITAQEPGIRPGGNALASRLTTAYNAALVAALPRDPRVDLVDVAGLFDAVRDDPAAFGFAVVDGDACARGRPSCAVDDWQRPDADRTYAFAAYGHFTSATRDLVAGYVHDEVDRTWGW